MDECANASFEGDGVTRRRFSVNVINVPRFSGWVFVLDVTLGNRFNFGCTLGKERDGKGRVARHLRPQSQGCG